MEFVIWTAALLGPVLLGVGGVFATWNRTTGLWVGFAGCIVVLVAIALYLQNDINKDAAQPKVNLQPPPERFVLKWEKLKYAPYTRLEDRPPDFGLGLFPTLKISNTSQTNALDASVRWQIAPFNVEDLLQKSPRFAAINMQFKDNKAFFHGAGLIPIHIGYGTTTFTVPVNYITKQADAFIPQPVWDYASIFILATLPEDYGASTSPFSFDVTVTWNIPSGSTARSFKVTMVATNAKLPGSSEPDLLAQLNFVIEDLDKAK
ncbi:hypothetical protein [Tardiphaga sp. 841_E9_N1_2]|uniref:hypothetical protein n=1 Tax=Tardiphaga sp. 841_E9_N1_2 TaxID=3240762 RepID=UPI003F23A364